MDDEEFRTWMRQRPSANDDDWVESVLAWCFRVPNQDMLHFHQPEWVDYMRSFLYSKMRFNPVRADRTFVFARSQVTLQTLPNATYRELLLRVVRMVPAMSPRELEIVACMLMAMEENNITGMVHVPRVAPFRSILCDVVALYSRYDVVLENGYTYIPEARRIVGSVMLCNTSVVFVINARLRVMMQPNNPHATIIL